MARIHPLNEALINQISAGEVVQRPASVVKELVENALDAEAKEIEIWIEKGGKERIQVADDGIGMNREDALLSIQRHTTSKIARLDDLTRIATMGFRGEALASISAVSRFTLVTSPGGEGTRVLVDHGVTQSVEPCYRARGATVVVENLFGKVPARRKFLRSPGTELNHIRQLLTGLALAHPTITFRIHYSKKNIEVYEKRDNLADRIKTIFSEDVFSQLNHFKVENQGYHAQLFVGKPYAPIHGSGKRWLMVNGRWVRDRLLFSLLKEPLNQLLPGISQPFYLFFLDLPPEDLDVNVHPSKEEVRFRRVDQLRALIASLGGYTPQSRSPKPIKTLTGSPKDAQAFLGTLKESKAGYAPLPLPVQQEEGFKFVGSALEAFLIVEREGEVCIIDQHAAHERVTYEKLQDSWKKGFSPAQSLMVPRTLTLKLGLQDAWEAKKEDLKRLGFTLDPLGEDALILRAHPAYFSLSSAEAFVYAFLASEKDPQKAILSSLACHRSVRFGKTLSHEEARSLLRQLFRCQDPYHCPHGRPTMLVLSQKKLENHFER